MVLTDPARGVATAFLVDRLTGIAPGDKSALEAVPEGDAGWIPLLAGSGSHRGRKLWVLDYHRLMQAAERALLVEAA